MRSTVTIDDDILAAARARADRTGGSLGAALSDLARRESTSASATGDDADVATFDVDPDAEPITSEDVYAALDE